MSETIKQLHATILDTSRSIADGFDSPDDDWVPTVLIHAENTEKLYILPLDPFLVNDEHGKDRLVDAIRDFVIEQRASAVSIVASAWRATFEGVFHPEAPPPVRPRDAPNREEALVVTTIDADGVTASSAPILRDGIKPPTLGEWEEEGGLLSGRFVDPFRDALKIVRRRAADG